MNVVSGRFRRRVRRTLLLLVAALVVVPHGAAAARKRRPVTPVLKETISVPEVYLAAPPEFLQPQDLPYFVAIEIPYDLIYLDGVFYLLSHGHWFRSDVFEGPWEMVDGGKLPEALRSVNARNLRTKRDIVIKSFNELRSEWPKNRFFIPENIDMELASSEDAVEVDSVMIPELEKQDAARIQPKGE